MAKKTTKKSSVAEQKLEAASTVIDKKIMDAVTEVTNNIQSKNEESNKERAEEALKPLGELINAVNELEEKRNSIGNIMTQSDAEEYLKKELEGAKKLKEEAQRFIKNNNMYTNSWNGINYGDF